MGWWRRFLSMPDRARARVLANASAGVIIVLLYALGGLSLYLRAHYLKTPESTPSSTVTATMPPTSEQVHTETTRSPTPTLYPTLTPRDGAPAVLPATPWPTITPTPTPGG